MAKTFKQLSNTDLIPEMSDCGGGGSTPWTMVTKNSGDTLENAAINCVTMNGNISLKLPAESSSNYANAFAVTIDITTKGSLTFLNNDGTTMSTHLYGPNFDDVTNSISNPLTVFNSCVAGDLCQFYFEETETKNYKISMRKLSKHSA